MNEDGQRSIREYTALGDSYGVRSAINAFDRGPYERPTLQVLVGEVHGQQVLDAGCASGRLTEWLAEQGASVVGLDLTSSMLIAAKKRLGHSASLVQADLAAPLPFIDATFHLIVSAFTLHYLRDWQGVLGEFRRILMPSGALVISTHHPANDLSLSPDGDYFATELLQDSWTASDGKPCEIHFYRRPLTAISEALFAAGFVIERILEAPPDQLMVAPVAGHGGRKPWFVCLRAVSA